MSRYELVPPPAPNTVARPTTLGACQVRLQLSTLFVPRTTRANFCVAKFSSFVALEQLKTPVSAPSSSALRKPDAARSSASSQLAARSSPPSRTSGVVSLSYFIAMLGNLEQETPHEVDVDAVEQLIGLCEPVRLERRAHCEHASNAGCAGGCDPGLSVLEHDGVGRIDLEYRECLDVALRIGLPVDDVV